MLIGSCVILHKDGNQFPALVIADFPDVKMVSVAYVSMDKNMYGNDIHYATSIRHADDEKDGNPCWSEIITPEHGNFHMKIEPSIQSVAEPYEGP